MLGNFKVLIADAEHEIGTFHRLVDEIRVISELGLENIFRCSIFSSDTLIIAMPHDPAMVERNVARLAEEGWEKVHQGFLKSSGATIVTLEKGDLNISMHLDPEAEGATCRLELVGHEQQPVYQLVDMEQPASL